MPADRLRPDPVPETAHHVQRRRSERRRCDLAVGLRLAGGEISARLTDLSSGGAGLKVNAVMALKPGERLFLAHRLLGEVACVLRWAIHPRYGVEFDGPPAALSRLLAFYDSLPPAPAQIL